MNTEHVGALPQEPPQDRPERGVGLRPAVRAPGVAQGRKNEEPAQTEQAPQKISAEATQPTSSAAEVAHLKLPTT